MLLAIKHNLRKVSIAYRHLPLSGPKHPQEIGGQGAVSIAYRHLPLSGLDAEAGYFASRERVSIAYRHLPLSGLTSSQVLGRQVKSLHCLSALTPFGT